MIKNKVDIITLGCSKNLVDSERLMAQFKAQGFEVTHDSNHIDGEIVVVNTCGFIGDAQEESINMVLELGKAKKEGKIGSLYVMGCLSERFLADMKVELPEVDKIYGKFNWDQLLFDIGKKYNYSCDNQRILTTPGHYAYLKIAEGCDRTCSYCAIPISTGHYKSRKMEDIEEEVKLLVAKGVKEFQVIAQDLTYYGLDLYKKPMLPELIERLSAIEGVAWLRLHYAYPNQFPMDLLRVMRECDNVCKYLDIALQHVSDSILKSMRRNITKAKTIELLNTIRKEVPNIHLRTTLMVGYPGETDADFNELIDFVKESRFERMGAFAYSHEIGTYAYKHYEDNVPSETKEERLNELMAYQEPISKAINELKVGHSFKIIIDREDEDFYVGRTEFDSPEVDPEVLIKKDKQLVIGEFYTAKITGADTYDLYGDIL